MSTVWIHALRSTLLACRLGTRRMTGMPGGAGSLFVCLHTNPLNRPRLHSHGHPHTPRSCCSGETRNSVECGRRTRPVLPSAINSSLRNKQVNQNEIVASASSIHAFASHVTVRFRIHQSSCGRLEGASWELLVTVGNRSVLGCRGPSISFAATKGGGGFMNPAAIRTAGLCVARRTETLGFVSTRRFPSA